MENLKGAYLDALLSFVEYTRENKQKQAKDWYKKMDTCFRTLRDTGKLSEIVDLLEHENKQVKLWVSTHLLVFDESLAKNALQSIANDSSSMESFTADMTLKEWDQGNLTYLVE